MACELVPTTSAIKEAFTEAVEGLGARMVDPFDDGRRLFLRSVLPETREVQSGDPIGRGVALRTKGRAIMVHPYVFRLVCRNGAIGARAVETRRVERYEFATCPGADEAVLLDVQAAVRVCCEREILPRATQRMQSMIEREAEVALSLLPEILRLPSRDMGRLLDLILGRFEEEADRSLFGLMNAVTSVARDARDPDTRWHLEEARGGMLAILMPAPTPDTAPARLVAV
jgi:hypothetical protein